ncbi:rust resistance kinase Lr10-like isoform X2 [Cornus florida]|uniref:rust resistance kinase Lr10-like isoform X2 n=1 Tax=Cornus florida TaxID=4283 RepID=UPI002899AEB2|nr:rust resistance kinase Lr10-like isoform X2 [Cornus florida]
MSPLPSIIVFLLSVYAGTRTLGENTEESFFKLCPPTRCSKRGPTIKYPFRLNTQPAFCGLEGFELSCSDNSGLLAREFSLVKCNQRIPARAEIIGPIDCLRNVDNDSVYVMDAGTPMNKLPLNCGTFKTAEIGVGGNSVDTAMAAIEKLLRTGEFMDGWNWEAVGCFSCVKAGNYCGFNRTSNETICSSPRPQSYNIPIAIGTSVGGTILLAVVILFIYRYKKSDNDKETQLKIENFLENYKTLNPTRYAFNDIKKITGRFKHKLGQGGFGSVYRGKLDNGVPVAVKMLENPKGNGEDFMNEVATISRIHHFNVVHLLGFCYEGTQRALVYEFMPNGSLEKYIFSKKDQSSHCPLNWEKLQEIAIGIARGIEYLHQGCNQRILHFDIKPHNILLDHNFQPRISDFGLAKLCSKDHSAVSMTAARGTAGYIAPEVFSRNFGHVSYKADVYSYGMLLIDMVGCRNNTDVTTENGSENYFPEWIYDRISQGKELGLQVEIEDDKEIAKKLTIVALWCIQWNPVDRPSMAVVVQMLEGDLKSLDVPAKPFVS